MVIRRCAWHPRYFGYPTVCGVAEWGGLGLRFSDWMCRRCARRVRQALKHGGVAAPPTRPAAIHWDPLVVAPPVAALIVVLAMVLMVTKPIDHGPAWQPTDRQRDVSALPAPTIRPMHAAARGRGLPTAKVIPGRTTFSDPGPGATVRAEARSPLVIVSSQGLFGLESIQAP